MIKYFKNFFNPVTLIYSYGLPKELVVAKVVEILQKKANLFTSNDMKGVFSASDTFTIHTIGLAATRGVDYKSTLTGQITESVNGTSEIMTKTKPSFALYVFFFVMMILGLIYLFKFIQVGSIDLLLWSFVIMTGGSAISIGLSNVGNAIIRERFEIYIDKELRR